MPIDEAIKISDQQRSAGRHACVMRLVFEPGNATSISPLVIMASVSAAILASPPKSMRLSRRVLQSDFHQLVDTSIKQLQKQERNKR